MKWVAVASFFVCFVTLSRGSAPSCQPGSEDERCLSENTEKVPVSTESASSATNVRERRKERRECLAGSEWESKCHKCRCSEDGHAECTRMEVCEKGDYGDPIRCKPRTTFKVDCNTCMCQQGGQVACTLIGCLSALPDLAVLPDVPALPEPSTTQSPWTGKRKDCLPGSRWKSKCNECFCSEDGLPACTEMACLEKDTEPEWSCAPESTWMNDCNSCWCSSGRAACTKMGCIGPINFNPIAAHSSTEKAQLEIDQIPSSDGSRVKRRATICKPTAAFKVFCNYCECASDGQSYSCTNYECMERDGNDDVEVFMESEGADHIERHSVCKPRGTFYIGCNTCHCSADGNDFSCTNKPCPLPKDVEVFHELKDLQPIMP